MQQQQMDNRYYTCMLYVKILGTPVYGFIPGSTQQEGPASPLGAHLSPVASRESSQTQFGGLQHGEAESEVEQSPGGVCEADQGDEEQKAASQQQQLAGKHVQYWRGGGRERSGGGGGVLWRKGHLAVQQTLIGVAVMRECF